MAHSPAAYDLFISYRDVDLSIAEDLHRRLTNANFTVWFDKARLDPGCRWYDDIEAGCENSRIVLPVLTPTWKESEWCRFETYGAEQVVPLLFSGDWPEVAPPPLQALQYVDFRQRNRRAWSSLFDALRRSLHRERPAKGPRLAFLRIAHNPFVVGRERLLIDLHERLFHTPTTALTRASVRALVGLWGTGKTTVAREYAEKFWRSYQHMLWVQGDASVIVAEFARLAVELGTIQQPSKDASQDAQRARRELNGTTPRLLIIDNALDAQSILDWVPTAGACHTIITSRSTEWPVAVQCVPVEELTAETARMFLIQRAGLDADAQAQPAVTRVAEVLGGLPLALEQAAAFVARTHIDFDRYLEFYAQARAQMLAQHSAGGTNYPESVVATWRVTVERLNPLPRALLRLAALLAATPVPARAFENAGPLLVAIPDQALGAAAAIPALDIRLALGELAGCSMVKLHGETLALHPLVQAVQIDEMPVTREEAACVVAVVALAFPGPEMPRSVWNLCDQLLPHGIKCVDYIAAHDMKSIEARNLLDCVVRYFDARGFFAAEEPYATMRLSIDLERLGAGHPEIARQLTALALVAMNCQDFDDADRYAERALALAETAQPRDDLCLARALNVKGLILDNLALHEESETCYRRALPIFENLSGSESPDVANNLNNLAISLDRQDRFAEAESFYGRALDIRRKIGEPDDVAVVLSNFAVLLDNQERFAEADRLYQEALPLLTGAAGPDHPHVAGLLRKHATSLRLWRESSGPVADWLFRLRTGRNRTAEARRKEEMAARIENALP